MSEIYTLPQLKRVLTPVFDAYGVRKAILFGSYAKGTATEKSDIDLLVDSRLRGLRFVGLLDDVQRTVGKSVDLFDVTHIEAGSRIDREIQQTGVTVYEKYHHRKKTHCLHGQDPDLLRGSGARRIRG